MSFPISKLIDKQGPLVTVDCNATVRQALEKMIANDFSQLPIVDASEQLVGLITEQTILNTHYHSSGTVPILDISVDNCSAQPIRVSKEADLFEALRQMQNSPVLVVVEQDKPVGIVTYYDTTNYFRVNNEGMMFVADIEQGLRQYVDLIFKDSARLESALINAFGEDKQNPGIANKRYDKLGLYDQVQLLTHEKNWAEFEPFFRPRDLFIQLMHGVRVIRNQLAHFRDPMDSVQRHALLHARAWLEGRPKAQRAEVTEIKVVADVKAEAQDIRTSGKASGRYGPLKYWLEQQPETATRLQVSFQQIADLLGAQLPPTAFEHKSWWANDTVGHVQSKYWLEAGWRVDVVDLEGKTVVFERGYLMSYHEFYIDLLDRVEQLSPGMTGNAKAAPRSWTNFSGGRPGFRFGWSFTRRRTFRVELTIDTDDKDKNQAYFEALVADHSAIETKLGFKLNWEPLEQRRSCRIGVEVPGAISDTEDTLSALVGWAASTTIKFVNVMQPYISALPSESY